MNKHSLIRTIYLYVATLIGLVILIIGTISLIDLGMKVYIFTSADLQEQLDYERPYISGFDATRYENLDKTTKISEAEHQELQNMIADYKLWEEKQSKVDQVKAVRQRRAATNIAMILVALPVYIFHWLIVRKEKNIV
ncbi:hypothetical protein A2533_02800 [Candidatus Falkowbacteria bacterium RIFOXYD2_FULL_35_9]|nr:MAG: hypothetical protein A2223_01215 [Candidatus Falkowbacteria bacterium RIFOXYA2_FULL_35_8]OGF47831.1 MAG: hypothetical protein A2533_02800 [Candidatus Falkowbacteria bacterium RIFOXYD2_FULL_35_9]